MIEQKAQFDHHMPLERYWVKYQLALRGIKYEAISRESETGVEHISKVMRGKLRSQRVETIIARFIGYPSWDEMMKTAVAETAKSLKGGAA